MKNVISFVVYVLILIGGTWLLNIGLDFYQEELQYKKEYQKIDELKLVLTSLEKELSDKKNAYNQKMKKYDSDVTTLKNIKGEIESSKKNITSNDDIDYINSKIDLYNQKLKNIKDLKKEIKLIQKEYDLNIESYNSKVHEINSISKRIKDYDIILVPSFKRARHINY